MRDNLSYNTEIQLYQSKVPIKLIYNNIQVKMCLQGQIFPSNLLQILPVHLYQAQILAITV